jgi:hypothetical protein
MPLTSWTETRYQEEKEEREGETVVEMSSESRPMLAQGIVISGAGLELLLEEEDDILCSYREVIFACV